MERGRKRSSPNEDGNGTTPKKTARQRGKARQAFTCSQNNNGNGDVHLNLPSTSNSVRNARQKEIAEKMSKMYENAIKTHTKGPLHNPREPGALILYPSSEDEEPPADNIHVVLDPRISSDLEKHQIIGIRKMWNWLTASDSAGFILADQMGLGKTLQCIAVLWTLVTQSKDWDPIKEKVKPTIQKCIIVCPKSVIGVWEEQLRKWLTPSAQSGPTNETCKILVLSDKMNANQKKMAATNFMDPSGADPTHCLICSYETFVSLGKDYQVNNRMNNALLDGPLADNPNDIVGLLVLDEAHYIKNQEAERTKYVTDFPVKKRIALTGTPIQNHLSEYYSIINFAEMGKLGDLPHFQIKFQKPIEAWIKVSKKDGADPPELAELKKIVEPFFLRRDANPFVTTSKTELIICCKMSHDSSKSKDFQLQLYNTFVECYNSPPLDPSNGLTPTGRPKKKPSKPKKTISAFQAISFLKNVCAHPSMIEEQCDKLAGNPSFDKLRNVFDSASDSGINFSEMLEPELSTKLTVLKRLLVSIRIRPDQRDRIVIVSSYTQTLDLIEQMLRDMSEPGPHQYQYPYQRFDGSTTTKKREEIIKNFNDMSCPDQFIVTLSSKAGGCGIRLIGGNHLVMFDPDWNPANDEQAISRIYREGQKKDCFIYRLLTSGSIEEVIFQKQMYKKILSGTIIRDEQNECITTVDMFGGEEELNALFQPIQNGRDDASYTHQEIDCKRCDTVARVQVQAAQRAGLRGEYDISELEYWNHIFSRAQLPGDCRVLDEAWRIDENEFDSTINFVFHHKLLPPKPKPKRAATATGEGPNGNDDGDVGANGN